MSILFYSFNILIYLYYFTRVFIRVHARMHKEETLIQQQTTMSSLSRKMTWLDNIAIIILGYLITW